MKGSIEDSTFQKCLSLLAGDTDEEKFVGIVLVRNVDPDDYPRLSLVYDSLGLDFLYRLLQTPVSPGVDLVSYTNLCATILSTFVLLEKEDDRDQHQHQLPNTTATPITNTVDEQTPLSKISRNSLIYKIIPLLLTRAIETVELLNSDTKSNIHLLYEVIVVLYQIFLYKNQVEKNNSYDKASKEKNEGSLKQMLDIFNNVENLALLSKFLLLVHNQDEKIVQLSSTTKTTMNSSVDSSSSDDSDSDSDSDEQEEKKSKSKKQIEEPLERIVSRSLELTLEIIEYIIKSKNNIINNNSNNNSNNNNGDKINNNNNNNTNNNNNNNSFDNLVLLENLSILFKDRKDQHKFKIIHLLVLIFRYYQMSEILLYKLSKILFVDNNSGGSGNSFTWLENIKVSLYLIFASKNMREEYRDQSIMLYSILIHLFGNKLIFKETNNIDIGSGNNSNGKKITLNISTDKYLLLALQVCRAEIHMQLLQPESSFIIPEGKIHLLLSCYVVIESSIGYLTNYFDEQQDQENNNNTSDNNNSNRIGIKFSIDTLGKVKGILVETMSIIINYLKQVAEENSQERPTDLVVSSLKLFGLWCSEETQSMNENLKLSLHVVLEYFLSFKDDYGFYLCFLLPGISFYIQECDEDSKEAFVSHHCHLRIAYYLQYYLMDLIQYIKESTGTNILFTNNNNGNNNGGGSNSSNNNNNVVINGFREYGVSVDTVINLIIPKICEILIYILNDPNVDLSASNVKSAFTNLFNPINDILLSFISMNPQNTDTDLYITMQYIGINLLILSLHITKTLNGKDISSSNQERLFSLLSNFYNDIEVPPQDSFSQSVWNTIKEEWVLGLELIVENIDKYPMLANCLLSRRFPPPDFRLSVQQQDILALDNDTILNVNRNTSILIRKLLGTKQQLQLQQQLLQHQQQLEVLQLDGDD
ncbi:hypothetical protein CYY_002005 [Polysphondylium violaceum]|uniref:Neurochondrin family protein n=1 Tax=Polysphondylium violaceum TaxID=133409 RepID=A0A8J4Q220_9MYCE|nr:hypothetical protein CYY_002005 [Polysphondylium violaceum]